MLMWYNIKCRQRHKELEILMNNYEEHKLFSFNWGAVYSQIEYMYKFCPHGPTSEKFSQFHKGIYTRIFIVVLYVVPES